MASNHEILVRTVIAVMAFSIGYAVKVLKLSRDVDKAYRDFNRTHYHEDTDVN